MFQATNNNAPSNITPNNIEKQPSGEYLRGHSRMKLSLLLTLILCGNIAFADQNKGFFAGGNVAYIASDSFADAFGEDDEITISAFELATGYKYNTWLGVDLRYGSGINEHEESLTGDTNSIEFGIDSYQSIYYRPEIVNDEAKLYFLIGYTTLDATVEVFSVDAETDVETSEKTKFSESGPSYGVGAGWFVGDDLVINVEYRQLLDKDEDEFSVITLGADYRF